MSLRETQDAFAAAVYDGQPDTLAKLVKGPREFSSLQGIDVYRNNTRERLKAVLAQTFPVCAQLVGVKCFEAMASAHVECYPCRTNDLEQYGENFPLTVARVIQEKGFADHVPYLTDMAKAEWKVHRAYLASDRTAFDFEAFAQLTEEEYSAVQLKVAPDLSALKVDWPIAEIWQMHQPDQKIKKFAAEQKKQWVAIHRPGYVVQVNPLDDGTAQVLKLIQKNPSLQDLTDQIPGVEATLTSLLSQGWITGFHLAKSDSN